MSDRRQEGTGALHVLPDSVIAHILSYFSYKELIYISAVSATLYVFCNDESVWQDIFMEDTKSTFTFPGSWKHATLLKHKKTDKQLELPKTLHFEGIYSMYLYTRWYRAHADVSTFGEDKGDLERKSANDFTVDDFINNYDALSRPVLICGATEHWSAHNNWSRESLLKIYGETDFKVSERGSRKFKMKLKDYLHYLDLQHDEEPLYIFDSGFGERAPGMLKDYDIPKYFPEDYFELLGKYKPSFRWFVMGPPHSGAPWHTDPAGTSAWNALLHGKKRWLLYPPGGMPPGVIPRTSSSGENIYISPSSLLWLLEVYPFLSEEDKPIECIQNPGEVIFVPAGWWHMVLNLTESTAVTQNYANDCNFQSVCEDFFGDRREIYYYFKAKLSEAKPEFQKRFQQFEATIDEITADFDDLEFWTPYIIQVLKQSNLPVPDASEITVLNDGTNPVFLAKDMVVKFYSKRFGGERNFAAETGMYRSASASPITSVCPRLLAHGKIEISQNIKAKALDKHDDSLSSDSIRSAEGKEGETKKAEEKEEEKKKAEEKEGEAKKVEEKKGENEKAHYPSASLKGKVTEVTVSGIWPYAVTQYISGTNILTAREEEMKIDMEAVAKLIATTSMVLHGLKVDWVNNDVSAVEDYTQFLQKRREKCMKAHWGWRTLPPALILQIEGYLPKDLGEIVCKEHIFTLHADLTDENVIGMVEAEKKKSKKKGPKKQEKKEGEGEETSTWVPRYLLDFGDARRGDIAYELVSLFISVFECKKDILKIFLENYTLPSGETLWTYYNNNKSSMVKRLMSCTLLHECDALATVFRHLPDAAKSNSMDELASLLWEL